MKTIRIIMYSLLGFAAASILFFIISFAYTSYETLSAQTTQTRLFDLQNTARRLSREYKEWSGFAKSFTVFKQNYLLKTEAFDSFRQELMMTFTQTGLRPVDVKIQFKSIISDVIKVSVEAELAGSYESVKRFIHNMKNRKEMILLKKIQFEKDKTGFTIAGKITMEVYFVR